MAQELKDTTNRIYQNAPAGLNAKYIITVGDVCTIKINEQVKMPDLSIIDFKTKRDRPLSTDQRSIMDQIGEKIVNVNNNAGTISDELWNAIETAISDNVKTRIIVEGEEDLATLAAISLANLGAKVIYGMPDKGMVVVDVNQRSKKRANSFLERMLVK
uniref:GTP-dependent dephospho-CoA kinase n=1 Tax=uncultured marine group II/III euryarchaeote KM3_60_A11 TaxID=1456469 RepID=A0A075HB19_9EURY|nr:hypothetical protein conserved in archaea [uncultured marine group II/III euryarchaeote KM3_60_A11]